MTVGSRYNYATLKGFKEMTMQKFSPASFVKIYYYTFCLQLVWAFSWIFFMPKCATSSLASYYYGSYVSEHERIYKIPAYIDRRAGSFTRVTIYALLTIHIHILHLLSIWSYQKVSRGTPLLGADYFSNASAAHIKYLKDISGPDCHASRDDHDCGALKTFVWRSSASGR